MCGYSVSECASDSDSDNELVMVNAQTHKYLLDTVSALMEAVKIISEKLESIIEGQHQNEEDIDTVISSTRNPSSSSIKAPKYSPLTASPSSACTDQRQSEHQHSIHRNITIPVQTEYTSPIKTKSR